MNGPEREGGLLKESDRDLEPRPKAAICIGTEQCRRTSASVNPPKLGYLAHLLSEFVVMAPERDREWDSQTRAYPRRLNRARA